MFEFDSTKTYAYVENNAVKYVEGTAVRATGNWGATTFYSTMDAAYYGSSWYLAVQPSIQKTPGSLNTAYWASLTSVQATATGSQPSTSLLRSLLTIGS